jgi:D-3-phosphoglycerate dehydrogenase
MSETIVVPDDFPSVFTGSPADHRLRECGDVTIHTERGADDERTLIRRIAGANVVLTLRAHARYSARVLAACSDLRLISVWGSGTDNVDLDACRARGITVTNTAGVNANAVAEHTLALVFALARRIPAMDAAVRRGEWPRDCLAQLEGKTLGIVGLGAIGRRVAALGAALGMRVLAFTWSANREPERAALIGARLVSLDELLRESDVVSLHLRLTEQSRGFLDRRRLALMRPTAFLVNTARAALVDRDALLEALRSGSIAGAGLDVFHEEPVTTADPLLALPNVILTPHNAGTTPEVIAAGLERAVENIYGFLRGAPANVVV